MNWYKTEFLKKCIVFLLVSCVHLVNKFSADRYETPEITLTFTPQPPKTAFHDFTRDLTSVTFKVCYDQLSKLVTLKELNILTS